MLNNSHWKASSAAKQQIQLPFYTYYKTEMSHEYVFEAITIQMNKINKKWRKLS